MRLVTSITPIIAFAAAACAACEFPYYPEYADVFSQYEEVTPLLAKKYAVTHAYFGIEPGTMVCEPLLWKDVAGMPEFYEISFYRGDDPDLARKWNRIITAISSGRKVPARGLCDKLRFFEEGNKRWQFKSYIIPANTSSNTNWGGGAAPATLYGFDAAYEIAADVLQNRDLLFTRMMTGDAIYGPVFEFENPYGKTVAVAITSCQPYRYPPEVADLDLLASLARISVRSRHRYISSHSASCEDNREWWVRLDEKIPDEFVEKELPLVIDKAEE